MTDIMKKLLLATVIILFIKALGVVQGWIEFAVDRITWWW